jgi:hypothetical protein
VPEDQELTEADWRTLCDTLRGSIAMFDMLLAECRNNSATARWWEMHVGGVRKFSKRSGGTCSADRGD